jgi:hypothetical protein
MMSEAGATYNGWTNWETWNLYTWLTNDEARYQYLSSIDTEWELKDFVAAEWDVDSASPIMDAWNQYLHEVDWEELLKAIRPEEEDDATTED